MKKIIIVLLVAMVMCVSSIGFAGEGAKVVNGYFVAWNGNMVMIADHALDIKFNGPMGYWMYSVNDVFSFGPNLMVTGYVKDVPYMAVGGIEIDTITWEVGFMLGR